MNQIEILGQLVQASLPALEGFFNSIFNQQLAQSIIAQLVVNAASGLIPRLKKDVPEAEIIIPSASVFIPSLEGYALNYDNETLQNMFYHLLEFSIHRQHSSFVHPAYPLLLKQLSSDEAKMLALLHEKPYKLEQYNHWGDSKHIFTKTDETKNELKNKFQALGLQSDVWFCNNHLNSLGLSGCWQYKKSDYPRNSSGVQIAEIKYSEYRLTDFGQKMMEICCRR